MDIKKGINQIEKSSNPIQRMIIAIVAPIVILLLGYGLINILDVSPDDFDDSWWLWLIIILCISSSCLGVISPTPRKYLGNFDNFSISGS